MDISEAVTEFHKMKRGNYAVSNSDIARLGVASSNASTGTIANLDIRQTLICNNRQEGESQAYARASHNRHERGSLCAEDCVQGEPL